MRQVKGTSLYEAERFDSIRDLVLSAAERHAELDVAIFRRKPTLPEEHRTYAQFGHDVRSLGTYIINSDYYGKRLAVVGENCYEWFVSYSAILGSNSIGIPLDRALPEGELVKLLERSETRVIFYHPKHHEMMVSIAEKIRTGEYGLLVERFVCMYVEGIGAKLTWPSDDERFVDLYDLISKGAELLEKGDESFSTNSIDPEEVKIILFTSGTTSQAKAVMLTNKNICSNVYYISQTLYAARGEHYFSILPLHHTFENTCDFFLISRGCCACFSDGLRYIVKNMSEWHIDFCISVPLLFENIYEKIIDGIVFEPEVGAIYEGVVTRIIPIGAFVEFAPGKEGMVHISKLDFKRTEKVEDVCEVGDTMKVKYLGVDEKGRRNLSRKDALKDEQ